MFLSNITNKLQQNNPWTNTYGIARSLLGLGTLLTLCFNDVDILFKSVAGIMDCPLCYDPAKISIFCLFKPYSLNIAKLISVFILLLVISGWKPRLTGILHWWVTFSLFSTSNLLDGGDQVANVLTLLLVPLTLTDSRNYHWDKIEYNKKQNPYLLILANITLIVIGMQVAMIYLHSAIGKMGVKEWLDGTALYYFFQDPLFATIPSFILSLFKFPFILTSISWLVMIFELSIFICLFIPRNKRILFLYLGILFHLLITIIFGLFSFLCSMAAALILLLGPKEFSIVWFKGFHRVLKSKRK